MIDTPSPKLTECIFFQSPTATTTMYCLSSEEMTDIVEPPIRELSNQYTNEKDHSLQKFEAWTEPDQVDFLENLLLRMCHYQHGQINEFLTPMLQRDFITLLPSKLSGSK